MRIHRNYSRPYGRRRRAGCLPLTVVIGLILGVVLLIWNSFDGGMVPLAAPPEIGSLTEGAHAAFARGDLDQAAALARRALDCDPDHVPALVLLAQTLVYRSYSEYNLAQDREAALEVTSDALQRLPSDLDLRAAHAFALQANRQPAAAAEAARAVLERSPDHGLARVSLALAYAVAGSHEIALRESLQAARMHPGMLDAQRALAIAYGDSGSYENAVRAIEAAIALNSRLVPLYFERALYALQLGDVDAATFAYMQVLAIAPENVKARLRLCELSSLLREREAAIDYCQQVTERPASRTAGINSGANTSCKAISRPLSAISTSVRRFR